MRLVEVAERAGTPARLVQRAADLDWQWIDGAASVGVTAGASAPEVLVEEVIDAFREQYEVTVTPVSVAKEDINFKLPAMLDGRAGAAAKRA